MRVTQAFQLYGVALGRQRRTLKALLIRDLMIRYHREGLGFAWLVLEPLSLIVLVMGLWSVQYGQQHHGVGVISLVLTGYTFLTVWRHVIGRSHFALRTSLDLKYHRKIQYGDVLLSRYLLEIGGTFAAFWVIYLVFYLTGQIPPIYDLYLFCLAWIEMALFCIGVGLILASLNELWEVSERFVPPLMYVTLPLTGSFYMVNWLPQTGQDIVLWSPLVHAMEMLRGACFGPEVPTYSDPVYLFKCTVFVLALGVAMLEVAKRNVKSLS